MRTHLFLPLLVTMVWTTNCVGEGLCPAEMKALFFCTAEKSKKLISLCQDGESVQYRYGTKEKIDLVLPESPSRENVFVFKSSAAVSEERGVGFRRGTYTYVISTYFGGKPPVEFDHVVVSNGPKEVADLRCSTDLPTSGNLGEIADKLEGQGFEVQE